MYNAVTMLCFLLFGHALADYPLQGEFLSRAKNPNVPIAGVPWYLALMAHASIQAGFVLIFTQSLTLAFAEGVVHSIIDYLKCTNRIKFLTDQALHVACKVLWVIILASGVLNG